MVKQQSIMHRFRENVQHGRASKRQYKTFLQELKAGLHLEAEKLEQREELVVPFEPPTEVQKERAYVQVRHSQKGTQQRKDK